MTHTRLLTGASVGLLAVAAGVALALDNLRLLVVIVGVAVVAGSVLNAWMSAVTARRVHGAIEGLQRRHERLEAAVEELASHLEDDARPLPPEHVEQLLRTVRAGFARVETSQTQLVADVEARLRPSPDTGAV